VQTYFNLDDNVFYLNHAAVSPWPLQTADAVKAFAEENARQGSKDYDLWLIREKHLRERLAQLINAPSTDEIALLKSTSEGLSLIAYGLRWNSGDNIIIPAEEFPSNRIVWQSLDSLGVETRLIPVSNIDDPEQALLDAMDSNTRLLSCSSVQYATGLKLDIERLGRACKQSDTAIQIHHSGHHNCHKSRITPNHQRIENLVDSLEFYKGVVVQPFHQLPGSEGIGSQCFSSIGILAAIGNRAAFHQVHQGVRKKGRMYSQMAFIN